MTDDPDYRRLLDGVLAASADDLPRLVLADWIEEHGNADRAEFIRVQCELARTPATVHANRLAHRVEWDCLSAGQKAGAWFVDAPPGRCGVLHWQAPNPALVPLWRRQDVLFSTGRAAVRPAIEATLPAGTLASIYDVTVLPLTGIDVHAVVRRGFVAEVRCTLAAFLGEPCAACEGTGNLRPSAVLDPRHGRGACAACSGLGRTPGVATALFREHPVERVTLTDRVPAPGHFGTRTSYGWFLGRDREGQVSPTALLPKVLWDRVAADPRRLKDPDIFLGAVADFATAEVAADALSDAALAVGREMPGVRP